MKFGVTDKLFSDGKEMRAAFCETMIKLAKEDERIILLDCDLMGAMGTKPFKAAFPERTIDCGIQENDMFSIAAGLSTEGKIPFAHTFGVFASRRSCDQITISCAYAKQNVKIIGSDPGITAALNGGTHMAFEDLGIMRTIPDITVVEPTDCVMLTNLIPKIAAAYGVYYVRLVRRGCENVYTEGSDFDIGRANLLREGTDVTIIAMGYCVAQAMEAARTLAAEGISAEVIDMFTLKPIDREAIIRSAKKTGAVVTAENHNINGALGSAVAEVLCESAPAPLVRIGMRDRFGIVGLRDDLAERFGLNAKGIAAGVREVIAKKVKK